MSVIKIENLWKEYRLGVIGHGTLTHDLQSWWAKRRGKLDPNAQIAPVLTGQEKQIDVDQFWALQDINLEINQGEILGIIGKNGAGKSTLLKVLSRVTAPSRGSIKVKGRIASLLEVGTGFHPELTGRENIFMNGAILGMSKQEIRSKLDEIIDFSGVERFVDTPVKRYSSGMYVRLAFAVAAHLEPEILVIDEVLAVGDADFQKKCLGKMGAVSKEGRTVLFVSHNMLAVKSLCNNAILLRNGMLLKEGRSDDIVESYLRADSSRSLSRDWDEKDNPPGSDDCKLLKIDATITHADEDGATITVEDEIKIDVDLLVKQSGLQLDITLQFCVDNIVIFQTSSIHTRQNSFEKCNDGILIYSCYVPANFLNARFYSINLFVIRNGNKVEFDVSDVLSFEVREAIRDYAFMGKRNGYIAPLFNWEISNN